MKSQRESVLVVDDDSEVLTALDAELSEFFDVTALLSAEQALATLQGQAFSAIISDVRMPGIDGLTLIKECAVRYPDMVRLLLTAFDDEEVQETALGEFGAYKLIKPWGDDLIVTLQNALKQRKSNVELQKYIDLGSAAVEVDLRLHLNLRPEQVLEGLVSEILRVPEVMCISFISYDAEGTAANPILFGSDDTDNAPKLTRKRIAAPEQDGKYFKYTVPVGMWPSPVAACVCRLTKVNDESLRYIDFICRQGYRTWLITSHETNKALTERFSSSGVSTHEKPNAENVNWISKELSMATTIMVSANESLNGVAESLGEKNENTAELEEISSDLDAAYASLTSLLEKLKS